MIYWRSLANREADGYSYASKNISSRLRHLGVLSLEDFLHLESSVTSVHVSSQYGIQFLKEPLNVKILINNCLPPDFSFDADYVVGFCYWETNKLPSSWISYLNDCDEVWTTSEWAKQVFIQSGVEVPVYNFNLGVDTEIFNINRNLSFKNPFTFMHIGSPSTRKNSQLAFDAFQKLFKNDDRYRFIIKSTGEPDVRKRLAGGEISAVYGAPGTTVVDAILSDFDLSRLMDQVNCFVYPTRGEGWGMAPFQAMAKGIPTICTNQTSCTEFAHLSVPLEAELSSDNLFGIYQTGAWANPKIDDVCDRMLYVVNNYQECLQKSLDSANYIHANYSWDSVVLDYAKRLTEIIAENE